MIARLFRSIFACMESNETVTISKAEYDTLKSQISLLEHQLSELKRMVFGAKRERFIPTNANQTTLFDTPEQPIEPQAEQTETITYQRKKGGQEKNNPVRTDLPAHLTRVKEVIEPVNLPDGAIKIGETITELLVYKPSEFFVRQIVRPKYIVSQTDEQTQIVTASMPSLPIPKGNADASVLAHILVSKYVDHLPFYRQVQIMKRQNLIIAESTINGWFRAACQLLEPIYLRMIEILKKANYLQADETPMPVLSKDKQGSTHKGYLWIYHEPLIRLVVFKYEKTRGREGPDNFLEDFFIYLQTDGYKAYNKLKKPGKIEQLACMAHARRKFEHAKENDPLRAEAALVMFAKLYDIERELKDSQADYDQIKQLRQQEAVPVLNQMKQWLDENINQTLPKSAIGQAIAYSLTLWNRLVRYTEDGRFQIDNNLIENTIRPVALGRKNYLFAGSHEAAQNAAMLYSILASCKLNNVNPFDYLNHTLSVISNYPTEKIDDLLPQNWKV
jgi:transposase